MAAEENQKKSQTEEEKRKAMLNLAEAWKKMYFETEGSLSKSIDEYVAGDSFTELLEQMGSQYLAMYKATNQNMDRFFDNHPLPTKKDLARVCELVITVEEKVDSLESDIAANMAGLASSLIRLVDFQVVLKDEILAIRREVQSLQEQLLPRQEKKAEVKVPRPPADKPGDLPEGEAPPAKPPRPRNRTKPTQTKK